MTSRISFFMCEAYCGAAPAALVAGLWAAAGALVAEVDGNRTRRTGIARPNRFEGGGAHQVPGHLPGAPVLAPDQVAVVAGDLLARRTPRALLERRAARLVHRSPPALARRAPRRQRGHARAEATAWLGQRVAHPQWAPFVRHGGDHADVSQGAQ